MLAQGKEAIVVVPIVCNVIQIQVPIRRVAVEIRNHRVVRIRPVCVMCHPRHHPLNTLGIVSNSESLISIDDYSLAHHTESFVCIEITVENTWSPTVSLVS